MDTCYNVYMLIYLITNNANGKKYIGQTHCAPEKRWQEHIYNARGNPARSAYPLYHAIRKYGPESFTVSILATAQSQDELNQKEIDLIATYQTIDKEFGYNRHEGGNKPPQHTPESRAKAAQSNRGQKRTQETKQRMSASAMGKQRFLGKHHSIESKIHMSAVQKERCRLHGGSRLGLKSSPEHCQRISAALTGKTHSEETRKKISASKTNPSDETRQRLRESHLGHRHSEETRKKMSESHQKRLAKKQPLPA